MATTTIVLLSTCAFSYPGRLNVYARSGFIGTATQKARMRSKSRSRRLGRGTGPLGLIQRVQPSGSTRSSSRVNHFTSPF